MLQSKPLTQRANSKGEHQKGEHQLEMQKDIPQRVEILIVKQKEELTHKEIYIKGPKGIQRILIEDFGLKSEIPQRVLNKRMKQMIKGVTIGFKEKLKFIGVGYKSSISNISPTTITNKPNVESRQQLDLLLGFNQPQKLVVPTGIEIKLNSNGTVIEAQSSSLSKLKQYLSKIELIKPARKDIYKGKGVRLAK
jgi:ribosomal protein L6P/L9E